MDENDKARPLELQERMRELYAAVESQQRYLFQVLGQSVDLLSASEKQADHLVVAFEHAAARVAPEWAKAEVLVRRAEALHHRAERARELRNGIVAAVAALAVITEESAAICLGLDTGREEAIDWIYGERLVQPIDGKVLAVLHGFCATGVVICLAAGRWSFWLCRRGLILPLADRLIRHATGMLLSEPVSFFGQLKGFALRFIEALGVGPVDVGAGSSVERGDGVARTCAGAGSLSIYDRDACV